MGFLEVFGFGAFFLNPLGSLDWFCLKVFFSRLHRRKKPVLQYWEFSLLKQNWLKIPLPFSVPCFFSSLPPLSQSGMFHVDCKFLHPFF